ncbi:hypothetical protein [Macrococcus armenti]|nr:hypothetical protein [Macrococcus armenti]UBH09292.1 hypothetical protein LAU41_03745 [Macrococcus armenti]UBH11587.1 hypothetical protein LAU38_03740 [Macrococcus armenti]UBH16054.1 hypothetical protein LAU44_03650 [Macrococcus armenti]UBH18414.1 hypothetical protein LAU39_03660 [Macrococcus armenti]UBH20681.1 hypothetical protein LAU40_03650 [Macrococcus armenti]
MTEHQDEREIRYDEDELLTEQEVSEEEVTERKIEIEEEMIEHDRKLI